MNDQTRRDVIEAVGVAAIVASLIFLAIETRQNTNALYAESRQAVLTGSLQELAVVLENPDLTLSIATTGPLTPKEQIRLDAFYITLLRAREFA